jgi:hypothetical protein
MLFKILKKKSRDGLGYDRLNKIFRVHENLWRCFKKEISLEEHGKYIQKTRNFSKHSN